jgi:putative transposase
VLKAYKYRINPTPKQEELINKHIGGCRFVYNLALETKQTAYAGSKVNLTCFDLVKQIPDLKKEAEWLKEINSQSLQHAVVNLDRAYTAFFKGIASFPRYKSKHRDSQSFHVPQGFEIIGNKLSLPKFKKGIDIVLHREIKGEIRNITISRTPTGKYFASILAENNKQAPVKPKIKESTAVGIDLGIKSFLVTSDGKKYDNPRFLKKSISKLKYTQRKYSFFKGKRTKFKLARLHEKVSNQRLDFLHKTSTSIISENQTICIEDLNIKGMVKNHNLAQSISDVGWGMFVSMLEYKAEWCGRNVLRIGMFEASTKTCSNCGYINKEIILKDREWTCPSCKTVLDRDINASINVKYFALKKYLSVGRRLKNQNELPTLVGVLTSEAPSLLGVE